MKRLCFLSPDVTHARHVVADLKNDGIAGKHIYVLAETGTELEDLPDGGPDADDFLPAFERGVALGGATGAFLGLLAMAFPPSGIVIGGGAILLIGAMGASVGGLLTGMAGASFHSTRLEAFEKDIRRGKILIMVDVPLDRVTHVNRLIKRRDPEVEIEGIEPPPPIIP